MKVLMCPPRHYAIRYEINPWMKIRNPVNPKVALDQWNGLFRVLRRLGVQVITLEQKKSCPDMVFTANAGVVHGRTFIPANFRHPQRQPEHNVFVQFFKEREYHIVDMTQGLFFEGEGDLLPYRDMFFGGFRFRSELRAHERVSEFLKKRLVGLELVHPHFYHLDTCFLPLDQKTVLYYPQAFDRYGRKVIQRFVAHPIPVGAVDAKHFACNGVRVGHAIVLHQATRNLKNRLQKEGYKILETPLSEYLKAGGSAKCLLLRL